MTAVTIDRKRQHSMRKLAAVLAGLLVLGIATVTTVTAWNESADQAGFNSRNSVVFSPLSSAAG